MMQIGTVVLDHDMVWEDEHTWFPRVGKADRALDGTLVTQSYPLVGGRPITLSSGDDHGFQSRATVVALKALAEQNALHILTIYGTSKYVRFRYDEGPVEFTPVSLFMPDDEVTEFWYSGTIRLVETQAGG